MAGKSLYIGNKIKKIRRNKNINQKNLAQELGISASYLNLIERNRRGLTVSLLLKLADILEVDVAELSQDVDNQVTNDLLEILSNDLFADFEITNQDIHDLASENPQIGKAVIRLFDKYNSERKLYQNILQQNSQDGSPTNNPVQLTNSVEFMSEIVSDYIQTNNNHFPTLETAAERVRLDIDLTGETLFLGLKTFGMNSFALRVVTKELPNDESFIYQPEIGLLTISNLSDAPSKLFCLAEHIGMFAAKHEIDDIIEEADFEDERVNDYLAKILARYFAASIMMPYDAYLHKAKETRYDIDLLCHYFDVSFEQACHRLTSLQKTGAKGLPFHFVRTDIAGHISKRFSLSGITIPRYGAACPRWNIYAAFLQPGKINVQLSETPDGKTYFCIARTITKGVRKYGKPQRHFSIGLGVKYMHAKSMVYSDSVDLKDTSQLVRIGATCPICQRYNCKEHKV